MGLSVTNTGALSILRNVSRSRQALGVGFEQQSTGLRIRRPSDSPSGFVIGELLRAQIGSVGEAISGTTRTQATLTVAEGGLNEVSNQLVNLRSLAVQARNSNDPNAQNALQAAADATLGAVDRVAGSTRFGNRALLNGQAGIQTGAQSAGVSGANFTEFNATSAQTLNLQVNALATNATLGQTFNTQAQASTVRVTGANGAQQIDIAAGATGQEIANQINAYTEDTGVSATVNGVTGEVTLGSSATGSAQSARLDLLSGNFQLTGGNGGQTTFSATGTDVQATLNGVQLAASNNTATVDNGVTRGTVTFSATGAQSVVVNGGGQNAQIGANARDTVNFGINSVSTASLGLSGLDLSSNDALTKIDTAINQVSSERARLGALSSQTFEPALSNLNTQFNELTASRSNIVDLDFASSVISQQRNSVLFQSGMSVLAQQNRLAAGGLMRLLGA
ncbi:MAG: hypothetical protein HY719_17810 [Planctomycetes bacterium]|nr:hypothetical protein [Planctomycetota bacterium]